MRKQRSKKCRTACHTSHWCNLVLFHQLMKLREEVNTLEDSTWILQGWVKAKTWLQLIICPWLLWHYFIERYHFKKMIRLFLFEDHLILFPETWICKWLYLAPLFSLEAKLTGIKSSRLRANSFPFQKQNFKKKKLLWTSSDTLKVKALPSI